MSDGDALLAAVLKYPDDDAPRLIYADWLDERGECERAEFVRVQCELAAWKFAEAHTICHHDGEPPCDRCCRCGWCRLRRRERELFDSLGANPFAWFPGGVSTVAIEWPQPPYLGGPPSGLLRRGFVESVTLAWADCAAHLDAILRVQPVRRVTLTTMPVAEPVDVTSWADYPHRRAMLRLTGRTMLHEGGPAINMLRAEWPGVEFTLPPAEPFRPGTRPPVGVVIRPPIADSPPAPPAR